MSLGVGPIRCVIWPPQGKQVAEIGTRRTWLFVTYSNMMSFFRFVDKQTIYRWYNLIRTCAGECDRLFHWQHKLCATVTFSVNVNINYRLQIKVYYRICTLRHIRIKINHGSQNVEF
jgi:hypothetical protein